MPLSSKASFICCFMLFITSRYFSFTVQTQNFRSIDESPYPTKINSGPGSSRQIGLSFATFLRISCTLLYVFFIRHPDFNINSANGVMSVIQYICFYNCFIGNSDITILKRPDFYRKQFNCIYYTSRPSNSNNVANLKRPVSNKE